MEFMSTCRTRPCSQPSTPFSAMSHGIGSDTPVVVRTRSACSQSGVRLCRGLVWPATGQRGVCLFRQTRSYVGVYLSPSVVKTQSYPTGVKLSLRLFRPSSTQAGGIQSGRRLVSSVILKSGLLRAPPVSTLSPQNKTAPLQSVQVLLVTYDHTLWISYSYNLSDMGLANSVPFSSKLFVLKQCKNSNMSNYRIEALITK